MIRGYGSVGGEPPSPPTWQLSGWCPRREVRQVFWVQLAHIFGAPLDQGCDPSFWHKNGTRNGVASVFSQRNIVRGSTAATRNRSQKRGRKLAKNAGFLLIDKSEINSNSKDLKNHPKGVWTLPPSLRLKDEDKSKYLEIGESDRMTLLFQKP